LARDASIEKAETELFDINTRLNLGKLRKHAAIQKKIKEILAKQNCQRFLHVRIASKTHIETKRLRRAIALTRSHPVLLTVSGPPSL